MGTVSVAFHDFGTVKDLHAQCFATYRLEIRKPNEVIIVQITFLPTSLRDFFTQLLLDLRMLCQ